MIVNNVKIVVVFNVGPFGYVLNATSEDGDKDPSGNPWNNERATPVRNPPENTAGWTSVSG